MSSVAASTCRGNYGQNKFNIGLAHKQNDYHGHEEYGHGAEIHHFCKSGHTGSREAQEKQTAFKLQIGGIKGGRTGKTKATFANSEG